MKAILVTACPAGIATSFLAAKRIEQQAKLAGWELTLDVGSSVQPRQVPDKEQIAAADSGAGCRQCPGGSRRL